MVEIAVKILPTLVELANPPASVKQELLLTWPEGAGEVVRPRNLGPLRSSSVPRFKNIVPRFDIVKRRREDRWIRSI